LEYDRLIELGCFRDERVELLNGAIVAMSPQGAAHSFAVARLNALLTPALVGRALVLVQSPFAARDDSEPEPDLTVVPLGNYRQDHPTTAFLVVEVADSSLRKDRGVKADLYAAAEIAEYWVVDLAAASVEVRKAPVGGTYTEIATKVTTDVIVPVAFPDLEIRVGDFLA
jgi:Uma2 family endonuclease